jgi:hypothetical protein
MFPKRYGCALSDAAASSGQLTWNDRKVHTMKMNAVISGLAISLALVAAPVSADGQLRGAMSAVSNVAGAIQEQSEYNNFKWNSKNAPTGPVVNSTDARRQSGFRWASHPASEANGRTAAIEVGADAGQTGTRWMIRNDVDQAGTRWMIRNDVSQSGTRWMIR